MGCGSSSSASGTQDRSAKTSDMTAVGAPAPATKATPNNSIVSDAERRRKIQSVNDDDPALTPADGTSASSPPGGEDSRHSPSSFADGFTFGEQHQHLTPGTSPSQTGDDMSPEEERLTEKSNVVQGKVRRVGVSAEPILPDEAEKFTPQVIPKSPETEAQLRAVVIHNPLFKALTQDELTTVIRAMEENHFTAGVDVLTQDEIGSERFYFIVSGTVDIVKRGVGVVCSFSAGQTFGEMELMYLSPCAATVRCRTAVSAFSIDRDTYRHIVMMVSIRKRRLYKELLAKVSWLSQIKEYESMMLADALERVQINKGDALIKFGDEGTWMYFVIAGTVDVIGRDPKTGKSVYVCSFSSGDCVGDLEFLNGHRAVADVVAKSDSVDVCRLHRDHFELCMGPLKDFLKDHAATDDKFEYYRHLEHELERNQSSANANANADHHPDLFSFAFGDAGTEDAFGGGGSPASGAFGAFGAEGGEDSGAAVDQSGDGGATAGGKGKKVRRVGVSDESQENDANWTPPSYDKTEDQRTLIRRVLKSNIILSTLQGGDLETLINAMQFQTFAQGTDILTQGGDGGEYYYVIAKGIVDILKNDTFIVSFSEGQGFGEMELMYVQPCVATVRARTSVETWAIDRKTYKRLVMNVSIKRRELFMSLLAKVEFLELMTEYERLQLSDALETVDYLPGQYLIRRGDVNEYMYLVIDGLVSVFGIQSADDSESPAATSLATSGGGVVAPPGMRHVTDLGVGACIGELEFLNQHPAVADCIAAVPTKTCRLHRDHFELCMGPVTDVLRKTVRQDRYAYYNAQLESLQHASDKSPKSRPARRRAKAVSAAVDEETEDPNWKPPEVPKSAEEIASLRGIVKGCPILAALDDEQQSAVISAMSSVTLKQGDVIVREGVCTESPAWYVIAEGTVEATKEGEAAAVSAHSMHSTFGEVDLMYATPSLVTMTVTTPILRAVCLDRMSYRRLVMARMMERRALYKELLSGVSFLSALTDTEQATLADALSPVHFVPGSHLVQAGHANEWMYIIADGIVEVFDAAGTEKICDLRRGEMVGELEFLNGHACVANCVAKTHVHACRLHREHFKLCMGPVQPFIEATLKNPKYAFYLKQQAAMKEQHAAKK